MEFLDTHITEYFETLFSTSWQDGPMDFLDPLRGRVKPDMSEELSRVFSQKAVYSAQQQMYLTKALGPDGMPTLFYQKYWHIVGKSMTDAILQVLNMGIFHRTSTIHS